MSKHHGELTSFRAAPDSDLRDQLTEEDLKLIDERRSREIPAIVIEETDIEAVDAAIEAVINDNGYRLKFTPEQMITAIVNARGNMTNAAALLMCNRKTVKQYIARFPEVRDAYLDQHDKVTDIAQSRLMEAIDRGEPWALMFYYREYLPTYVFPVRGDSGRFPALLPMDENYYDPDLDRLSDDELAQLDELATILAQNQDGEGSSLSD